MRNLRDLLDSLPGIPLPTWLSDHSPKPSYGFRLLWTLALLVDGFLEVAMQGSLAGHGRGTSTALEWVGEARGMIRNQDESDEDYGRRLGTWVDRARENGSPYRLAVAIHEYLRTHPRVRAFQRNGDWITVDTDGTITTGHDDDWDWDSVSHPERNTVDAPWWSDVFIIVYTRQNVGDPIGQWEHRPGTIGDLTGDLTYAIGHLANNRERDDLKRLVQLSKAAHTCIRAIVWTSDPELFVPGDPASMPDGTWGSWGINVGGSQVPSGRIFSTCRFWEPR